MSSDWPLVQLGDHCTKIGSGATPSGGSNVYTDVGEICLIRSQNIHNNGFKNDGLVFISTEAADKLKNVVVEADDVLLNITGDSVARVCLARKEYLPARVNQHVAIIRPNLRNFDSRYLCYQLSSPKMQALLLGISAVGATRNALTKGMIESLEVVKPPLKTQKSIADKLERLDKKIELNRQTNQTLEQIAQALFKSWFVDFEPTRAKIAAKEAGASPEEIERAAMCAISGKTLDQLTQLSPETQQGLKTTAALFPDALVDSELGEVPEGWFVKQLSELGNIVCGKTPPKDKPEYYCGDIPFIKIPDMHGKMYATKTSDTLTPAGADTQIKKLLPKDSVCVSCIATVGLVSLTCVDSFTNQQINTIIPTKKSNSQYIYFAMLGLNDHLHDLASGGSATLNLNTGHFSKIKIVFPDEEVLDDFSNQVKPIFDLILKQSFEIDSLEKIRDSLLPKLLSGEIQLYSDEECAKINESKGT